MRSLFLTVVVLFFAGQLFSQGTTPQGKSAKTPQRAEKPTDPKVIAVLKEIEEQMVRIESGSFTMGCVNAQDSDCYYWEKPRHTVTISTFNIGKFPVTQRQWKTIMGADPSKKNCPECPVVYVSWHDANMFITKLNQMSGKNYRLPTEAEWEYAAKGGNTSHGYKYAGGNVAWEVAWYDSTLSFESHPVGKKKANELGLYDMSGNVWQWCSDWFDDKYYTKGPSNNPPGPAASNSPEPNRALRGGSWWGPMKDCRVSNRDQYPPDSKDDDVGFRIARN